MSTNRFERTRQDHRRERAEDYLEMIAALIEERGEARAVDLAERMGVTHVSVGKTVRRLQEGGFVTSLPYRSIFLTDVGRAIAEKAKARHLLVHDFLVSIGVPHEIAEVDAEGIEHHVSEATLDAMSRSLSVRSR